MEEKHFLNWDELDFRGVLKEIYHNWWVIVLSMASAVMLVSVYFSVFYKLLYTSEATIAVVNTAPSGAYSGLTTSAGMAQALSKVFYSDILWDELEKELNYVPERKIDVTQIENTNLVCIQLTADDAEKAQNELQMLLDKYEQFSDYIFSNAELTVISNPAVPDTPSNQISLLFYGSCAAMAAFVVSVLIIICIFMSRHTVKNIVSARRSIDAEVYGVIHHENKRGGKKQKSKSVLITNPTCSFDFEESFNRLASRVSFHMEQHQQQVLLVTSSVENEGKSTVISNLALAMAKRGKKVLIIDTDFRKPALFKIFDCNIEDIQGYDLYSYLSTDQSIEKLLVNEKRTGLYMAFCTKSVSEPEPYITSGELKTFIQKMRRQTDYILLDSPPAGLVGDAELLAELADTALFVVRHDFVMIDQINYILNNLKNSGIDLLGCVLNDMNFDGLGWTDKKSGNYGCSGRKNYSRFEQGANMRNKHGR